MWSGWTDPKGTRAGFGALMVGRFNDARGKPARAPIKQSLEELHHGGSGRRASEVETAQGQLRLDLIRQRVTQIPRF